MRSRIRFDMNMRLWDALEYSRYIRYEKYFSDYRVAQYPQYDTDIQEHIASYIARIYG